MRAHKQMRMTKYWLKKPLASLLIPALLILGIIPLFLLGWYGIRATTDALIQHEINERKLTTLSKAADVKRFLQGAKSDTLFLSKTPPIQGIIRSRSGQEFDAKQNSYYEQCVSHLEIIFRELARAKPHYLQLRFIDETGQELVRINSKDLKTIHSELQNKAKRPYFIQTMKLQEGQTHVSPLDLNIEHGKIQIPHTPVIRYATPVFDEENKNNRKGIVIINISAQPLLDQIKEEKKHDLGKTFLVNHEGFYLAHPEESKEWGADLGTDQQLDRDYPKETASSILSGKAGVLSQGFDDIFVYQPIVPDPLHPEKFWVVVQLTPKESFASQSVAFKRFCALLILLGGAFISMIFLFYIFRVARPIKKIIDADLAVAQGEEHDIEIPEAEIPYNEIGQIMRSRNEMIAALNQAKGEMKRLMQREKELAAIEADQKRVQELQQLDEKLEKEIAERKKAKEKLEISQVRFQEILSSVGDAVVSINEEQKIILFNEQAEEIFEYKSKEIIGKPIETLIPHRFRENHREHVTQFAAKKISQKRLGERGRPLFGVRKNGEEFEAEITISKTKIEGKWVFTAIVRDISERKLLEEQFLQAQKMESIGQLAGGIAHDFNNQLIVITGYSQMLLSALDPDDPKRWDIEQIKKAGERSTHLTQQLLSFSRRQIISPKNINLNELILNMDKMLGWIIGEEIELVTLPASQLGIVKADPAQIEHVLVNLVVNARDAMPQGGKLTLTTANVLLDQKYAESHQGVTPGEYVLLCVNDTGVGMSPEAKAHIFEPFFTTKGKERGTGLGLATCYGIVKQNGGVISVYSEPGHGTTIKLYFPRVKEAADILPGPEKTKELPRGNETILLVEDENSVRELTSKILRQQGYNVLEAANGEEALRKAKKHDQKIHLLLADVIMPQMGGKELADQIESFLPKTKVLFMSGYTDNAIGQHGVLKPNIAFIQKPFSAAALAFKIRELLDK